MRHRKRNNGKKIAKGFALIFFFCGVIAMIVSVWLTPWEQSLQLFLSGLIVAIVTFMTAVELGE